MTDLGRKQPLAWLYTQRLVMTQSGRPQELKSARMFEQSIDTMIKSVRTVLLASVVAFGLTAPGCAETERPTIYVSLVQLLASPEDYTGYPVTVTGHLGRDGRLLFLSAEHAEMDDVASGIPVGIAYRNIDISEHGIASTGCEDLFVRVLGVFERRADEYRIASVSKISVYDETAGLNFEGEGPSGGSVVCWPN